jgi:PPK2 family polyphosphate:nucleotide phosphotransferase
MCRSTLLAMDRSTLLAAGRPLSEKPLPSQAGRRLQMASSIAANGKDCNLTGGRAFEPLCPKHDHSYNGQEEDRHMPKDDPYRIGPDAKVKLADYPPDDDGGVDKADALKEFAKLSDRLVELQELMYAEAKHALLVVLQAMDAGGKDSTIRNVFGPINPQGCIVINFKAPSDVELKHDFLWRIHQNAPRLGYIGVFNRSHYEDVLIVRVKNLVPKKQWQTRYEHINEFESMLTDEGTTIVKFFLHISKDYQKERLQRRLDKPDKLWKFNPVDLAERARWHEYREAYEEAMSRCSTEHAPWYVIPAERKWYRNLLIARILVRTLESLDMKFPKPTFDPKTIRIE